MTLTEGAPIVTNSQSVGGAAESLPNTSRSRTRLNARDVKPSISTFKEGLAELVNNPKVFAGQECFVGQMLFSINKEETELLKTALADKRIRHVDLVRLCEAEGYKMSEATMRRHRAGGCRCSK
jgi:hypothetical protein